MIAGADTEGAYSQKDGRKRKTTKTPTKTGRDDVPQSTSVLTKQSTGGGRGRNAGRKTGRPKAVNQLGEKFTSEPRVRDAVQCS
ncbi:hypothetical protein TNCV_1840591 [Trichonephila clavipes]|nr:hypothetical protein TNCV_1840591 [Trichonephila clavipes]